MGSWMMCAFQIRKPMKTPITIPAINVKMITAASLPSEITLVGTMIAMDQINLPIKSFWLVHMSLDKLLCRDLFACWLSRKMVVNRRVARTKFTVCEENSGIANPCGDCATPILFPVFSV